MATQGALRDPGLCWDDAFGVGVALHVSRSSRTLRDMDTNNDSLNELLKAADRAAGAPASSTRDLATRVRQGALRRRRRRLVVGTATVVSACFLALLAVVYRPDLKGEGDFTATARTANTIESTHSQNSTIATNDELARLAEEAEFQAALARRMIADIRHEKVLAELRAEYRRPDPLEEIQVYVDTTARRALFRGDRLREQQDDEAAAATYKDIIRLFPQTPSATLARQRLDGLTAADGESS